MFAIALTALTLAFHPHPEVSDGVITSNTEAPENWEIDSDDRVTRFYEIPLDLNFEGVPKLGFEYFKGYSLENEGGIDPTAVVLVPENILIEMTFNQSDGSLYRMVTSSPAAIGPGGIAVGTPYKDLQAKFPDGRLIYGIAHGYYVVFTAGKHLYFDFDPRDMYEGAFALPDVPPPPQKDENGNVVESEWRPKARPTPDYSRLKVKTIRVSGISER